MRFHVSFGSGSHYRSAYRPATSCAPVGWSRTTLIWNSCDWNRCNHSWAGRCRDECYDSPYWQGFRLGQCAGKEDGYRDGLYAWRYDSDPSLIPAHCSGALRYGFIDGYRAGYREGVDCGHAERLRCNTLRYSY